MNTKTTQRHTAFHQLQKECRMNLADLHMKLLQTKFPSSNADEVLNELIHMLDVCDTSTSKERQLILRRIQPNAAAIVSELEKDHEMEEELASRLRYLVKRWRQTGDDRDSRAILFGLGDFISFKVTHLNREERELLPILWQHFSDEELIEMESEMYAAQLCTA